MPAPDPAQPVDTWPGPLPFEMLRPRPVDANINVQAHPSGLVQFGIATHSGVTIIWLQPDVARKVASDMVMAASGIVVAQPGQMK